MNILVVGTGAVGGYFGAKLAKAGENVTFLTRGRCFDVLNSTDLKVKSFKGDFSLKANVVNEVSSVGDVDLVVLCVKSYDTETSINQIKSIIKKNTLILSLQNGVENGEKIRTLIGNNNVLAGVVMILAEVVEPWTIDHSASGKIIMGEFDGTLSDRLKEISEVFKNAEIQCINTPNIQKELWKKLVWNAAFNSITALTGTITKEVLGVSETRSLVRYVMEEVLQVAKTVGHDIGRKIIDEYITISEKTGFARTSMLQDKLKGKPLEIEAINGAVLKYGEKFSVSTPYNTTLYALLKLLNIKNAS